jgi:Outer membrane protein transport protein (OMPP1/FadL/TodX)
LGVCFYDASPELKFGLAVTAPFGLNSQYGSDWIGRYQAIKSNIETINVNLNIAYRVSDWLSIGGGPAIQYVTAEPTNAINSTTVARRANRLLPAGLTLPNGSIRVTEIRCPSAIASAHLQKPHRALACWPVRGPHRYRLALRDSPLLKSRALTRIPLVIIVIIVIIVIKGSKTERLAAPPQIEGQPPRGPICLRQPELHGRSLR